MPKFTVWRLMDGERDLWLPTACDTFDEAAEAWLEGVQAGERMMIMEEVPVALRDARGKGERKTYDGHVKKPRPASITSRVTEALRNSPVGLSRKQLAERAGCLPTEAGSAVAGLMKRGIVQVSQRASGQGDRPAPGRNTVSVYTWIGGGDA